jgi:peptidylprolyl isomerase
VRTDRSACYTSVKNQSEYENAMKQTVLILLLAASTVAASAQTPVQPATTPAKPAVTAAPAKPAAPAPVAAKPAVTAAALGTAKPATAAKPAGPAATKPVATAAAGGATPEHIPILRVPINVSGLPDDVAEGSAITVDSSNRETIVEKKGASILIRGGSICYLCAETITMSPNAAIKVSPDQTITSGKQGAVIKRLKGTKGVTLVSGEATLTQSPAKPAAPAAKAAPATPPTVAAIIKAPANIVQYKGLQKPLFTIALRYQDVKVGTGAPAETGKLLKYKFTLWWLAADGQKSDATKFDATEDHPGPPQNDKDGKPVLGDDGKPKPGDPLPMPAIMGQGRPLPGWDMGVEGMKVGGKRRVFIPWQLGFGAHEVAARDATHPAVPGKSDLILDVELVSVEDAPPPQQRPHPMGGGRPPMSVRPSAPGGPGAGPAGGMGSVFAKPAPTGAPAPPAASATPAAPPPPGAAPKPGAPGMPSAPPAPNAAPAPAATPAVPAPGATPAQPPSK